MSETPSGSALGKHSWQESVVVGLPRGVSQPRPQMGFCIIPVSIQWGLKVEFISHQPGDLEKVFNLFMTQLPYLQIMTIRTSWDCWEG